MKTIRYQYKRWYDILYNANMKTHRRPFERKVTEIYIYNVVGYEIVDQIHKFSESRNIQLFVKLTGINIL
jgi:hypothetical protein